MTRRHVQMENGQIVLPSHVMTVINVPKKTRAKQGDALVSHIRAGPPIHPQAVFRGLYVLVMEHVGMSLKPGEQSAGLLLITAISQKGIFN